MGAHVITWISFYSSCVPIDLLVASFPLPTMLPFPLPLPPFLSLPLAFCIQISLSYALLSDCSFTTVDEVSFSPWKIMIYVHIFYIHAYTYTYFGLSVNCKSMLPSTLFRLNIANYISLLLGSISSFFLKTKTRPSCNHWIIC